MPALRIMSAQPDSQQELWFVDLRDYWTKTDLDGEVRDEISGRSSHG